MTAAWLLLVLGVSLLCVGGYCVLDRTLGSRVRNAVDLERGAGNLPLRTRMRVGLGRQYIDATEVARAETMWGWVWIWQHRDPPDPWSERIGWRMTRRGAERALRRVVASSARR